MGLKRSLAAFALPLALVTACGDDTDSTGDSEPGTASDAPSASTGATATTGPAPTTDPAPTTAAPTTAVEAAESVSFGAAEFDTTGTPPCDPPAGVESAWLDASGSDPEEADGLALGSGTTGVMLLHQNDGRICRWLPFAEELVANGYSVVLPIMDNNEWPPPLIPAGMDYLRDGGSETIAVVGASMGGTFALAAQPGLSEPADTVVAVSAPSMYLNADAAAVIADIEAPLLLLAAEEDSQFAEDAEEMAALAPDATLEVRPGRDHGVVLVDQDETTRSMVLQAIADAGQAG